MDVNKAYYCHPHALVETNSIGAKTKIWAFVHILANAVIGENCNVCDHCFIEGDVKIGNNVTLKCGVYLWDGITLEDYVFVGPNVVFTNDLRPRSKNTNYVSQKTIIQQGASLGANTTILGGITVGRYAMVGIGSVVTRNVPSHALVYGNPARQHGWVDEQGNKLMQVQGQQGSWMSAESGQLYQETSSGLGIAHNF
jgi:acetyltransferase-like isoleucine patch superfamily enzyme